MAAYIGLAVGLILAGLLITLLSPNTKFPLLCKVFFWVGIVLAVFGLVLLLDPFIHYVANQVRSILGQ